MAAVYGRFVAKGAHLVRAERLQAATGALATAAMAAMEDKLPWFGKLSAQDRSWIGLVAQSGISAFVEWFRDPEAHSSMPTRIFGSAPREFTRVISLHQTVDLVRTTIETIENTIGTLLPPADVPIVHEAIQRYAREVAFAAATVYAQAAEMRGAWDARLEALLVDSVIRGEADESVRSRASALGWTGAAGTTGAAEVAVVVGRAPAAEPAETPNAGSNVADLVRHAAREAGADALCAIQGDRLVVVLGGTSKPVEIVQKLAPWFGPGPIVVGPVVKDLMSAVTSARAAVAGLRAAAAWPGAPRPVPADELLPERSLSGDGHARRQLANEVYAPLTVGDGVLLDTVSAYLDSGGSIEATARAMFIHANTVRYRLKRVADITGYNPLNPRDSFTLRVALTLGRLLNPEPGGTVL
ncbi:PucR-like helix-turn-helix protein [Kribbella sp. VKM Ac-2571]|uniref:PucR family transcriptional regulator n=1 Tax=Kribbella sp. VKM Ac-2571 TaxID=2512222 RepID=UPI00105E1F32|nr:helix-turn-helix domain-containing protein [Kribbella sp. VKM Ac-2571]TDO69484.1 PucR-like helix-turn-helix protein [Kribbella sp. VKM Ac-2571]